MVDAAAPATPQGGAASTFEAGAQSDVSDFRVAAGRAPDGSITIVAIPTNALDQTLGQLPTIELLARSGRSACSGSLKVSGRSVDLKLMGVEGETHSDFEARFWLNMVTAGGWVTLLMCLAVGVYAAEFAADAHRLGVAISALAAMIGGAITMWVVPWNRIIGSRWREPAFFTWTISTIAIVTTAAALDGGARSPLALMLFLPTVFSSMTYPLRLVAAAAALAEAAYGCLLLIGAPPAGYSLTFCAALGGTALLAVWQAANHDVWRGELARSAITDPLTGVLNRRGFEAASRAAFSALERKQRPVTVLIIDLDLFKAYNDTYGHRAGDELLCWVASRLSAAIRPSDTVARLGGDEFAVLLPDTDTDSAEPVIERIRASIESRAPHCMGSACAPERGSSFDALYRVADRILYECKTERGFAGGNDLPLPDDAAPRQPETAAP